VKTTRRAFTIGAAATTSLLPTPLAFAQAEQWPQRDIHVICGFPAGSGADIVVRFFAEQLRQFARQPVIVENRTGASSSIALQAVARAKPDGYTLLIGPGNSLANNSYLLKNLPYDAIKDFAGVTTLIKLPFVLCTRADETSDVKAFIGKMKAKGKKSTYGYSSNLPLACGELFKERTGILAASVSYKSNADIIGDLNNGLVDFFFGDLTAVVGQGRQNRIKLLAVSTVDRSSLMPDVPTLIESGVADFDLQAWFGAWYPTNTPQPIINQVAQWLNQSLASEAGKSFLSTIATADAFPGTPASLDAYLRAEIPRWAAIFRMSKIEPQ
jgi:tripartite-type tricarboxylate transporter receptor subunit TctC